MRKDKEDALRALVGDEKVDSILAMSAGVSEQVENTGLKSKELDPIEKALSSIEDEETRKVLSEAIQAQKKEDETSDPDPDAEPAPDTPEKEEPKSTDNPMPDKAAENAALAEIFADALAPLAQRLDSLESSVKEIQDTPRHSNPLFRASSSKDTEVPEGDEVNGPGKGPDVLNEIVASMGLGQLRPPSN